MENAEHRVTYQQDQEVYVCLESVWRRGRYEKYHQRLNVHVVDLNGVPVLFYDNEISPDQPPPPFPLPPTNR